MTQLWAWEYEGKTEVGFGDMMLPAIPMDEDFFEFIEDELCYTGGPIDIGLFALYYQEWEKVMVE